MSSAEIALIATASVFVVGVLFLAMKRTSRRSRSVERLFDDDEKLLDVDVALRAPQAPLVRGRLWIGPVVALVAFGVFLAYGWIVSIAVTAAAVFGVLAWILDQQRVARATSRLEAQLGDAIDVVTGALGAGTSVTEALEHAAHESAEPLRSQLAIVCRRLRLGDEPHAVIGELSERAPLETYRLFTFALTTHWDVGGSLTPTLVTVGRAIRDRIDIGRRVRAQAVESQLSVVGILAITYGLLVIQWVGDPAKMEGFLLSPLGASMTSVVLALQALGLLWMTRVSTIKV